MWGKKQIKQKTQGNLENANFQQNKTLLCD